MMGRICCCSLGNCYGKSAGQLCPPNQPPDQFVAGHLMGRFQSPSIILACSGIPLWSTFPLQHRSLLRDGVNAAYPLCSACSVLSRRCHGEALSCRWWVRAEDRLPWGQRKGDAASSSSPPACSSGCLAHWAPPNHSGWSVLAHIVFSSPWVQQLRRGSGDCFLTT